MELNKYQSLALRTAPTPISTHDPRDREHALLGLVSETGEIADQIKRHIFYGKPLDLVNLKEELGDVLWYIPLMCRYLGVTLEDVAAINIAKLAKRYPDKFNTEKALNRDLAAERQVLETPHGVVDVTTHDNATPVTARKNLLDADTVARELAKIYWDQSITAAQKIEQATAFLQTNL